MPMIFIFKACALIHCFSYAVGDFELTVELGQPGTIISPGYYHNKYPRDIYTSWTLTSSDDMFLYCIDLDIETCCDVVYVSFISEVYHNMYQVDRTHLLHSRKAFLQTNERIKIVFTSNEHGEGRGFVFKYLALSKKRKNAKHGEEYFASTEQLNQLVLNRIDDPTTLSCKLTIQAPSGHRLKISVIYTDMEPSVYCTKDFVRVYEGMEGYSKVILLHHCGNATYSAPVEVISIYDHVTVEHSCQMSAFSDSQYFSTICGVLNYQAVSGEYDDALHITDITVNFEPSPLRLGTAYESVFKLDISHLRVVVTSLTAFGLKLQRYLDNKSNSDYIEILLDFHNGSLLTTHISMNIRGRPIEYISDQVAWYLNTTYTFWILIKDARLWFGHGDIVSVDTMYYIDMGRLFEFNAVSLKGNMGSAKILSECDSLFLAENQTLLTNLFGEVYYIHLSNSYISQLWLIETSSEDDIVRLDITENRLAVTPDCLLERVSIYRGSCQRKSTKLTYFCGNTIESYTQTVGRHTTIEYMSSPIPSHILEDQSLLDDRVFSISYHIISPSRLVSSQAHTQISLPVAAIISVVCCVFVIIIVAVLVWRLKERNRPRLTRLHPRRQYPVLQVRPRYQPRRNHRIASYINQPTGLTSLPHTHIGRQTTNIGQVESPAVFRGVPPSALYSRHGFSMPPTGRTRFGLPRRQ